MTLSHAITISHLEWATRKIFQVFRNIFDINCKIRNTNFKHLNNVQFVLLTSDFLSTMYFQVEHAHLDIGWTLIDHQTFRICGSTCESISITSNTNPSLCGIDKNNATQEQNYFLFDPHLSEYCRRQQKHHFICFGGNAQAYQLTASFFSIFHFLYRINLGLQR